MWTTGLSQIETDVKQLATVIGAGADDLPSFGSTRDFGQPHVEANWSRYHYIVVERGVELERKSTSDYDQLLYWIFQYATYCLAFRYELENRVQGQDCRRIAFSRQVELLSRINPGWAKRQAAEIAETLRRWPYQDEGTAR